MDAVSTQERIIEQQTHHVTWEEWLAWAPDSRITEWIDGEVLEMSPIGAIHDEISQWLIVVLRSFLRVNQAGKLRAAPSVLRLSEGRRGREPDLMFIAAANLGRITPTHVEGPADAVWEIVSPESIIRDWHDKYREYETEGVREYWVIDPQQQRMELYRLGEDGRYRAVPVHDGKLESAVISGFYLRPEWLWSDPLPLEFDVARELGVL